MPARTGGGQALQLPISEHRGTSRNRLLASRSDSSPRTIPSADARRLSQRVAQPLSTRKASSVPNSWPRTLHRSSTQSLGKGMVALRGSEKTRCRRPRHTAAAALNISPPRLQRPADAAPSWWFEISGDQDAAARGARLRELRWKNNAWLATADTIAGWNGLEIRNAGSGRSPVRNRSG